MKKYSTQIHKPFAINQQILITIPPNHFHRVEMSIIAKLLKAGNDPRNMLARPFHADLRRQLKRSRQRTAKTCRTEWIISACPIGTFFHPSFRFLHLRLCCVRQGMFDIKMFALWSRSLRHREKKAQQRAEKIASLSLLPHKLLQKLSLFSGSFSPNWIVWVLLHFSLRLRWNNLVSPGRR